MKLPATAVLTLVANSCAKGQHDINPRSRGRRVSSCVEMFVFVSPH